MSRLFLECLREFQGASRPVEFHGVTTSFRWIPGTVQGDSLSFKEIQGRLKRAQEVLGVFQDLLSDFRRFFKVFQEVSGGFPSRGVPKVFSVYFK